FAEDRSGVVWANASGTLVRFEGSIWESAGETFNLPSDYVKCLRVARDGTLWVVTAHEVVALRPGQSSFEDTGIGTSEADVDLIEAPNGTLWLIDAMLGARALYVPGDVPQASQRWIPLHDA